MESRVGNQNKRGRKKQRRRDRTLEGEKDGRRQGTRVPFSVSLAGEDLRVVFDGVHIAIL